MSNLHLPAELLDHVVDYLHDTQDTLRNCCLVSKSWVPRARKHLFADIGFPTEESVRSWKETFPDPSTSPAHYTQNLSVSCNADTASDAEASGWIGGFSRVVRLELGSQKLWASVSFTPFHGLSLVVKSLHVIVFHLPSSPIFDLILSFPLLEDLVVIVREVSASDGGGLGGNELLTAAQRSSRPTFTGSLELYLFEGMEPIARRLLSLPSGLHFRKLALTLLRGEDLLMMVELVEECSHTLESLKITSRIHSESIQHLCSYRQLTSTSRRAAAGLDRPLENDKTQRYSVWAQYVEGRMDHHGTPDHHPKTSRSPTNHD